MNDGERETYTIVEAARVLGIGRTAAYVQSRLAASSASVACINCFSFDRVGASAGNVSPIGSFPVAASSRSRRAAR